MKSINKHIHYDHSQKCKFTSFFVFFEKNGYSIAAYKNIISNEMMITIGH